MTLPIHADIPSYQELQRNNFNCIEEKKSIWKEFNPDRGGLVYRKIGNLPNGPIFVWAALYYYIITKKKFYFIK
jgi:hypothetical protein